MNEHSFTRLQPSDFRLTRLLTAELIEVRPGRMIIELTETAAAGPDFSSDEPRLCAVKLSSASDWLNAYLEAFCKKKQYLKNYNKS